VADDETPAPAFGFDGAWPFTGSPAVAGHPLTTVSSFTVTAPADGIPVVTLTLVGEGALRLQLAAGAAQVAVSDETREALTAMGWRPPADS
jgi:hypothetical protein